MRMRFALPVTPMLGVQEALTDSIPPTSDLVESNSYRFGMAFEDLSAMVANQLRAKSRIAVVAGS